MFCGSSNVYDVNVLSKNTSCGVVVTRRIAMGGSHSSDVLVVVDGRCISISRLGRWLQDWELVWQQEILDLEYTSSCDL